MHAYLIVGKNTDLIKTKITEIASEWGNRTFEFNIQTIVDVRNLKSLTKLISTEKTSIVIKNIHLINNEGGNALLKSLEEPDQSTIYILTASSESSVQETIASRCQIIYTSNTKPAKSIEIEKFLNLSLVEKIEFLAKIKDRSDAVLFLDKVIDQIRYEIYVGRLDYSKLEKDLTLTITTRERIRTYGNLQIQFTNFAINL